MKQRFFAALIAAMVLTAAAGAAKQKYPSYLTVEENKDGVWASAKNKKKLPADLVIPDGVTSIGDGAFNGNLQLKTVTYGGTKEDWERIEKGSDIFWKNTEITDKDGNTFTVDKNGTITVTN